MRCRPGDLAVVVRALTPGMLHRFVIVERLMVQGEELEDGTPVIWDGNPTWIIRSAVNGQKLPSLKLTGELNFLSRRAFDDACLRPIRPNDGEDETLSREREHKEVA